jgi:hypothetical protein
MCASRIVVRQWDYDGSHGGRPPLLLALVGRMVNLVVGLDSIMFRLNHIFSQRRRHELQSFADSVTCSNHTFCTQPICPVPPALFTQPIDLFNYLPASHLVSYFSERTC